MSNHTPIHDTPHLLTTCQVAPPKSHRELLHALSQGPKADAEGPRHLLTSFHAIVSLGIVVKYLFLMVCSIVQHTELRTVEQMTFFFTSLYPTPFSTTFNWSMRSKVCPHYIRKKLTTWVVNLNVQSVIIWSSCRNHQFLWNFRRQYL